MATPAQVYAALTIENTYHILYPTAPKNYSQFNDITNWAGLGYTTGAGDVVKGIFKCIDPAGQVIYENAGYASDDFSSQDWDLTDITAPQFNLLTYTGTDTPIYGDYLFLWKVQITPNGLSAFQVDKQFSVGLSNGLAPQLSLEESYDCSNATYTSVDTTVYGAPAGYTLQNIARTHVTRPPLVSKQSNGTTAQSAVSSSSQTNLLAATANPLWTGAYSSSIAAILTYKSGNNYTIVNCAAIEKDLVVTCDNGLCDLFCYLKKLYTKYFEYVVAGNSVLASMELAKWQKASDIFLLIQKALTCSTGDVEALTAQFYKVTGFTQGCDCGCSGDEPAPVIPTTSINGTNGTDGLTAEFRFSGTLFQWKYTNEVGWTTLFDFSTIATAFLQGAGAPSNGDGNNGDTYLDVDSGNIYLKTAGAWAITGNITGPSGTTVLANQFPELATLGTAYESLLVGRTPYVLPANTLTSNGDEIKIHTVFVSNAAVSAGTQLVRNTFNGNATNTPLNVGFYAGNVKEIIIDIRLVRTSNTEAKYEQIVTFNLESIGGYNTTAVYHQEIQTIAGLNFTTTAYNIDAQGNSDTIGDISCKAFEVELLKI